MSIQILILVVAMVFSAAVAAIIVRKRSARHQRIEDGSETSRFDQERAPVVPNASRTPRATSGIQPDAKTIFISYRRKDSGDITGRIYDGLVQHFGKMAIFKDVDSIPLGMDFRNHLQNNVGRCSALIAVIGQNWLIAAEGGEPRLNSTRDHLRIEIETALQRDIPVIPVLVQGATVPQEDDLPSSLRPLAYRNGLSVRPDPDFHTDMDRLIRGVEARFK